MLQSAEHAPLYHSRTQGGVLAGSRALYHSAVSWMAYLDMPPPKSIVASILDAVEMRGMQPRTPAVLTELASRGSYEQPD
jgi:hypothetical protein